MRAELLASADNLALTTSLSVRTQANALHSMGGIGKSVAARALCDDPAVLAARGCARNSPPRTDACSRRTPTSGQAHAAYRLTSGR